MLKIINKFAKILPIVAIIFAETSYATTYIAVLETISQTDLLDRSEKAFLTDKLGEKAKGVLPDDKGFVIMTRENINAMLPAGTSLEECEGSCLVETGKNIAADYVAQARIGKFGSQLTLTVELYETAGNNLVGTFSSHKPDAEGLLDEIENKSDSLFVKILGRKTASIRESKKAKEKEEKILIDKRDGKRYRIARIGKQVWMAENLNFIPKDGLLKKKSWCYYSSIEKCDKYGRLYDWKVAKNVCPSGWHLPNTADFEELIYTAGGKNASAEALKSREGWKKDFFSNANGKDKFGFTALPGGFINVNGISNDEGKCAIFWSSTEQSFGDAFCSILCDGDKSMGQHVLAKKNAFSVRCIKDEEGL